MNDDAKDNNELLVEAAKKQLKEVMSREITLMRELLSNMNEEQQAILKNDPEALKAIMKNREPMIDALFECKKHRDKEVKVLSDSAHIATSIDGDLPPDAIKTILQGNDVLSCEILTLRDQILALVEQMQKQNERNNYLLQNKVYLTKEMIRRLYPNDDNTTYSNDGTLEAKKKRNTVMVINREV